MSDAEERFIEAAVRPLGDNAEMQVMAERELRGMVEGREMQAGTIEEATLVLGHGKNWGSWAVAAAVVASLAGGGIQAIQAFRQRDLIKAFIDLEYPEEFPETLAKADATEAQRWLLFNDAEALHDSDPENPAYFANYCRMQLKEHQSLPPDFLETVKQMDPRNGYFLFMAAETAAKGCVESDTTQRLKKAERPPAEKWIIKDQRAVDEALALLRQAAEMPEWQTYCGEIVSARFDALRETRDLADRTGKAYLQIHADGVWFNHLPYLIAARAEQCGENGDREGLHDLAALWEALALRLLNYPPPTLFYGVVMGGTLAAPIDNFRDSARKLGEHALEEKFRLRREAFDRIGKERRGNPEAEMRTEMIEKHGSHLAVSCALEQFAAHGTPIAREEELKPGRLADYALVDRGLALACWVVFGLACLLVSVFRFRGGTMARRMSGVLAGLMRPSDHAQIIAGGILAPFVFLLLISRFTFLGGREWSAGMHGMMTPTGQWLAAVVLMLSLPVLLVKGRLGKRAGFLGLGMRKPVWGWIVVALIPVALVTYGLAIPTSKPDADDWGGLFGARTAFIDLDILQTEGLPKVLLLSATGGIALGLLWLIGSAARALFSSHGKMLERSIISRAVIPAYLAGMVLMALAALLHHSEERYWVKRDQWMEVTAESAPISVYEHRLAKSSLERLRAVFKETE